MKRLESVFLGKDNALLDSMFDFYAPKATRIIDVCCNTRKMWRGSTWARKVKYCDIDPSVNPDRVCAWDSLPVKDCSVEVLVYDPPHLPVAAASEKSMARFAKDYGLALSAKADNIAGLHTTFLTEARRVLREDGLIFAKIKDYIHNHRYQWNLMLFNQAVISAGMTPCDVIIKRDPTGGNLKSGRWQNSHHAKNVHCFWAVVRNSNKCEGRKCTKGT